MAALQTTGSDNIAARRRAASVHFERERGVDEVRVERGLAHATIRLPGHNPYAERLDLLQRLASAGVPVFMVKLHPGALSFAVREDGVETCRTVLEGFGATNTIRGELCLVSIYAGAMRDLSGVMAKIYEATVSQGIRILQTGDAYNAVHLLVACSDADPAVDALCAAFSLLDEPEAENVTEADAQEAAEGARLNAL